MKALRTGANVLGAILAVVGAAGVPEDLRTWATWLSWIDADVASLVLAASGFSILLANNGPALWRRAVSRTRTPGERHRGARPPSRVNVPAEGYPDGTLVREYQQEGVYLIVGGAKFWLPREVWLERFGKDWSDVRRIPAGATAALDDVPAEGTLLREWSDLRVFRITAGQRALIANEPVEAVEGVPVHVVPDRALSKIPINN